MATISDFWSKTILVSFFFFFFFFFFLVYKLPNYFLPSFQSTDFLVQEKKRKIDLKGGGLGGQLGFPIVRIFFFFFFFFFDIEVAEKNKRKRF